MSDEVTISKEGFAKLQELKKDKELRDLGIELTLEEQSVPKGDRQQLKVAALIESKYDIIRVAAGDLYYYRDNTIDSYTYTKLSDRQLKNLVRWAYKYLGIPATANKIEATAKTVQENVEQEVANINKDIIEIVPGFYWDSEKAEFTDAPDKPCFLRLFDNTGFESQSVIDIQIPDGRETLIKGFYRQTLKWLELMGGDLLDPDMEVDLGEDKDLPVPITFPFIWTWASQRHGTYMDMLKMVASVFMKNKPMGAFILTGLRRNGKSTMVKMIHTLLGRANTSSVRLSELSDTHKNLTLSTTLFNAPDEETEGKDMDAESVANFKTMAAHEPLLLPVLYETKPQWVSTNFISVSPMNAEPEWKGSSASACMQRSLIIQFHADLSKFDNSGKDFAKDTFTEDMYTQLLGVVLAIAHYYSDKPMKFSDDMEEAREVIGEQVDNKVQYADLFNKWFVGYKDKDLIYADYRAWCKMHGGQFASMKDLMFAIKERGGGIKRTKLQRDWCNGVIDAYRLGLSRKGTYFLNKEYIPELQKTIENVIYVEGMMGENNASGNSVVQCLEDWLTQSQIRQAKEAEDGE